MEYYVVLTGSKNNSGDFLIKYRALQLFNSLRPDRNIIDFDAWKVLTDEQLEIINSSKALILCGGPSLQTNMYPKIYALVKDLDLIKVPIITLGIGYKDMYGAWEKTHKYELSNDTIRLLDRIKSDSFVSSVRDYHTLNVLLSKGYDNYLMTGCPALYDLKFLNTPFNQLNRTDMICFSLGVSYLESEGMFKLMQDSILTSREIFLGSDFVVLFHHKINTENSKQRHMVEWLKSINIPFRDISGEVNMMIHEYAKADFHIGYRVHAHILMSSMSKPSVLINEDSRGRALSNVIEGLYFDAHLSNPLNFIKRGLNKFTGSKNLFLPYSNLSQDLRNNLKYELQHGFPRILKSRRSIDGLFVNMKEFISKLP